MAYYNEEQLYRYFDKTIKREAEKRIKELNDEIEYLHAKEMKKVTEDLEAKRDLELNKRMKELQLSYQDKINQIGIDYDAKLLKERTFMTNIVFNAVLDRIYQFITSPEYEDLMKNKLGTLLKKYPDAKSIITISDRDTHLPKIIKEVMKSQAKIVKSPEIHLGGFEFLLEAEGLEVDETIDTKLIAQKEWFYKNSKLFIRK